MRPSLGVDGLDELILLKPVAAGLESRELDWDLSVIDFYLLNCTHYSRKLGEWRGVV